MSSVICCDSSGESDKRMITGTPVCTRAGEVACMQVIWKGKTQATVPKMDGTTVAANLYHEWAERKCQTMATWANLLYKVQAWACKKKMDLLLPQNVPTLLQVDNVPSHGREGWERVGPSSNLYGSLAFPHLYLYFGIPNLSHLCNPGDQIVNLSLRKYVRQQTKLRTAHWVLDVCLSSTVPPLPFFCAQKLRNRRPTDARLPMGEPTMKPLLTTWVSQWLSRAALPREIELRFLLYFLFAKCTRNLVAQSWTIVLAPLQDDVPATPVFFYFDHPPQL